MDAATWARCSALLDEALDLPANARARWLAALAAAEPALAATLEPLLKRAEQQNAQTLGSAWLGSAIARQSDRQAGDAIGPWRLIRPLGVGGMGEVWLATRDDGLYEGEAALKFIKSGLGSALADRFARERRVLARLNHPGIARLLDAGLADDQPYLVLEYVVGQPLLEHARRRRANTQERVRLLLAAAHAVQHAHTQLVAHRDLKPSNLLVTREGEVKLLDFGIASLLDAEGDPHTLTSLTGPAHTPGYAAPEQITGEPVGVAADVFALGVLLFELLAGERPFAPGETRRTVVEHAVLHGRPASLRAALTRKAEGRVPDAPHALSLAPVVERALQRQPEHRYAGAAALADDLQRWLEHRPLTATALPWTTRSRLWLRRNRIVATATALVLVSLACGLVAALYQRAEALRQAERATQMRDYLLDTLGAADPDVSANSVASLDRVLERAGLGVAERFATDPASQALLLQRLASIHNAYNQPEKAVALAEQSVQAHRTAYGADSVETAWALREWSETLFGSGRYRESVARAREAVAIGQAQRPVAVTLVLRALHMQNLAQFRLGALRSVTGTINQFEQLVFEHYSEDAEYRAAVSAMRGHVLQFQGRWAEALTAYELALKAYAPERERLWRNVLLIEINQQRVQARLANSPAVTGRLRALEQQSHDRLGSGNRINHIARMALAESLAKAGALDEALQVRSALAEEWQRISGPTHDGALRARAAWLQNRMQLGESSATLGESLHTLRRDLDQLTEISVDVLHARSMLLWMAARTADTSLFSTQCAALKVALDALGAEADGLRELLWQQAGSDAACDAAVPRAQ